MKYKKVVLVILSSLIISSYLLSAFRVQSYNFDNTINDDVTIDLIEDGKEAIDWNLEEIISDRNKTFSNFAGKVVVFDFFATWCVPCRNAMPHLRAINDHYASEPNFQMMSFGVTLSETESMLETFAENYNMNWYIFRDTAGVADYYGVSAIPTIMIISQSQFVYYSEEGFSSEQNIINLVDELLNMDDQDAPVVQNLNSNINPISVRNSTFTASATVNDDFLRHVKYKITLDEYTEVVELWKPDTGTITNNFNIDPYIIWSATQNGTTEALLEITASDFNDATTTVQKTLDVENLVDASPPEIAILNYNAVGVEDTVEDLEVITQITDDTLVVSATAEIWIDDALNATVIMTKSDSNTFIADFQDIDLTVGQELSIKIIAEDISGKLSEYTEDYKLTLSGGLGLPIIITLSVISGLIAVPLIRKYKK